MYVLPSEIIGNRNKQSLESVIYWIRQKVNTQSSRSTVKAWYLTRWLTVQVSYYLGHSVTTERSTSVTTSSVTTLHIMSIFAATSPAPLFDPHQGYQFIFQMRPDLIYMLLNYNTNCFLTINFSEHFGSAESHLCIDQPYWSEKTQICSIL